MTHRTINHGWTRIHTDENPKAEIRIWSVDGGLNHRWTQIYIDFEGTISPQRRRGAEVEEREIQRERDLSG